jgi:valyl-tRNA synthetase
MKPLAEKAIEAVKSEQIKIIPEQYEKVYFHWMDNIRDWCISRQLWWGHQIPVWYKGKEVYCGLEAPKGKGWVQDEDVLDTWFSSGLWPFSTLGWPKKTKDYDYFFPNTVMETGKDILFFWVARMIMMSLELTGKIPFETVYLHGMVQDEHNKKMSKSSGNALDPLTLIEKYGTDAIRMSLVVGATPGQNILMSEPKIKGYRNFSNKIWNASRFVTLRVSEGDLQSGETGPQKIDNLNIDIKTLTESDKDILDLHKKTIKSVTEKIEKFRFSQAGEELYEYFWHQFCDIYIEKAKAQLDGENKVNTKKILIKILSESLAMLHPFVPFVTEAVWQELREIYPKLSESLIIASWPKE